MTLDVKKREKKSFLSDSLLFLVLSISSSLSLMTKTKVFSLLLWKTFYLSPSTCPDPSCWWSGSSVQWWWPAQPSAAFPGLGPPDPSLSLIRKQKENHENSRDSNRTVLPLPRQPMLSRKDSNLPGLLRRHLSLYSTSACLSSNICCFVLKKKQHKQLDHQTKLNCWK